MGREPGERNPRDIFNRAVDAVLGRETADRIREHNREIEEFGNNPEPNPSESPSPEPRESPRPGGGRN